MNNAGRFIWYELYTPDPIAAKAFYGELVGWKITPFPGGYEMFTSGETPVAGVLEHPELLKSMNVPPHWFAYVAVEDVDATCVKAVSLGASQTKPPFDIPGVGRIGLLVDPQGVGIGVYRPATDGAVMPNHPPGGHFSWAELATTDAEAAFDFYRQLFGWVESSAMDMGPAGKYYLHKVPELASAVGGIFRRPPEMPASSWLYYVTVPDVDAAVSRIGNLGGKVLSGPMDVPGGDRILQALDPQGVMFALHARPKA